MASRDRTVIFLEFRNKKNPFYQLKDLDLDAEDSRSDTSKLIFDKQKFRLKKPNPVFIFEFEKIKKTLDQLNQQVEMVSEKCQKPLDNKLDIKSSSKLLLEQFEIMNRNIDGFFPPKYCQNYPDVTPEGCKYPKGETESSFCMKKNLRYILVTQFNLITKKFRANQMEYMKKVNSASSVGIRFNFDEVDDDDTIDFFGRGYTQMQQQQLNRNTTEVQRRLEGIRQIHDSILHIATIFRQVNDMVVEQGTLIDTVEHNLENAGKEIKMGVENIEKADELHQRSSRLNSWIIGLAIACAVTTVVIVIVKIAKG